MNISPWFVYILQCANGALYTGIAVDVEKRLQAHNAGKGSRYVRAHRPARLLAFTPSESKSAASSLEYAIKAMPRRSKLRTAAKWKLTANQRTGCRVCEGWTSEVLKCPACGRTSNQPVTCA